MSILRAENFGGFMMKLNAIILFKISIFCLLLTSCGNTSKSKPDPWTMLFNGKNLDGWEVKIYHHELGDNYAETFRVRDSMIVVDYSDYTAFNERYGHLFYTEPFSSYHLKFKYKFTDQWMADAPSYTYRNSGLMFHSQDPATILKEQDWPLSIEYQMLADAGDGAPRPTGNMCSPGTDVVFEGAIDPRHCINSSSATYPPDVWVSGDLIVYQDSLIIHKVNGEEVLRYAKPQIGGDVANGYNPEIKQDGKALKSGYIALQAEGQGVMFKDIKVRNLE